MSTAQVHRDITKALTVFAHPERARVSRSFFKTGTGEYGEGDKFLGVSVPDTRRLVRTYRRLSLDEIESLLTSSWHEERLLGLLILVDQFKRATTEQEEKNIVDFYLAHTACVNNWDLVDTSAPAILGGWLLHRSREILTELAHSSVLWERRIAVVATLTFIREKSSEELFRLTKILINDTEDLIQKALGWMLREVGKKCGEEVLNEFLKEQKHRLPRTALRYAIERHSEEKRKSFLSKE